MRPAAGAGDAGSPRPYAGAMTASVTSVIVAVILLTFAGLPVAGDGARSVALGLGLVVLSTGLTLLVSAVMYRAAPAATAPALAVLYLAKVTALGWWLLALGAPEWLRGTAFAVTVAAALVASWLLLAPVALRATAAVARQDAVPATAPTSPRPPGGDGATARAGGVDPCSEHPGGDHEHP